MEQLQLNIKNDNGNVQIEYSPCFNSKTIIYCTTKQLKSNYKVHFLNDISISLVRRILKEGRYKTEQVNTFNSIIITKNSFKKRYSFQIDGSCVLITNNNTKEELWSDINKIKDFWLFNEKNWKSLKEKKKNFVPISHDFLTNDNNFTFE